MSRLVAGVLLVVVGLVGPWVLLPTVYGPWTVVAAWVFLAVLVVGVLNVARAVIEAGWLR